MAEAKRKADEEAERKWKADEAAEKKRKADEAAEKARKKEEVKQKKQKESMARQTRGRTTMTMGLGDKEAEGSVAGKKRKRVQDDDDDSQNGSAGAPFVSETTGPDKIPAAPDPNRFMCVCCELGDHECLWDGNQSCLRCCRMHLGCDGREGKGKGKETVGVKRPWVVVVKKESGGLEVGTSGKPELST